MVVGLFVLFVGFFYALFQMFVSTKIQELFVQLIYKLSSAGNWKELICKQVRLLHSISLMVNVSNLLSASHF